MKPLINWKVFLILWIASILAVIAVLPYLLALQSSLLQNLDLPIPLPVAIALQVLQSLVIFAVAIFGGPFFASHIGLVTPLLDAVTCGESVADRTQALWYLAGSTGSLGLRPR